MAARRTEERPQHSARPDWASYDIDDVLTEVDASADGLTEAQVTDRRARFGRNELPVTEPAPWWLVLLRQFKGLLILLLLVAAVITALQQEWIDVGAIIVVVSLNAIIGFWQERKAESDVRALQRLSTTSARVDRADGVHVIDAALLVPGDLVLLESGDRIPADLRLIQCTGLRVDESMLTGEVLAVTKRPEPVPAASPIGDRSSMGWSGTLVVSGRGTGVVVATGEATELGAINSLVQGKARPTPLQRIMARLERSIGIAIGAVAVVIFVIGIVLGNPATDMFRTAVALVVSAMPEALPVVLSVALGVGVSRMAARHAIVRRLPSVETLGSTTIIASDKTGTLTQNRLTVEAIWTLDGRHALDPDPDPASIAPLEALTLRAGALANEAHLSDDEVFEGDAVDVAMARASYGAGATSAADVEHAPRSLMPYEPELGYSQAVVDEAEGPVLYVKGAPDLVVQRSSWIETAAGPAPIDVDVVLRANRAFADDGLRVIATARRALAADEPIADPLPVPEGLTLLGLEAMADPPRPGVPAAIAECRSAGINVMMVTGDHPATAAAIGARLGLATHYPPLTGSELEHLDDPALLARLRTTSIAARMAPQDKLRIVEVLQRAGETVAVTGDGVNDAPALKAASVGIAMGESGTEVAREAADVVLADDNFVTIVDAVRQGRVTFSSIRKATFFLLSSALASVLAVAVNMFSDLPLIFLPVMLLWMNIVTNGIQDVALALEPGEGDELTAPPRDRREGILSRTMWLRTIITGVWMGLWTLVAFRLAIMAGLDIEAARGVAMTTLVMSNFFQALSARAERTSLFRLNPFGNPVLIISALAALLIHFGAMQWSVTAGILGIAPIGPEWWLLSIAIGFSVLAIVEAEKWVRRHRARPTPHPVTGQLTVVAEE